MSKTILFPTDFSLLSLKPVQIAIQNNPTEKLDIVLVHGVHLSDSITDLLYFSKNTVIKQLSNDEFENACQLMQQLFNNNINSMRIELFTGFNQSAFNAFLSGLQIDQIYVPASELKLTNKTSMSLAKFIERSASEKIQLKMQPAVESGKDAPFFSQINFAK